MTWKSPTGRRISFVLLLGFTGLVVLHHGFPARPAIQPFRIDDATLDRGTLVIAGGGCVTAEIRERFVALAGGPDSRIVVIPAVDPQPGHEDDWLEPWRRHGAGSVEFLNVTNREAADDPSVCLVLTRATGVWISGGYQSLLAERYVDTRVEACLKDVLRRNGVVGGCSAGAAILSSAMIQEGEDSPVEACGLGLINAIVDQHFLHRNRLWRMQQMTEAHPDLIGIGVDEGTALVVDLASGRLTILGDSYALVCLPRSASGEPRIEVLKSGDEVSLSDLWKNHLAYHPLLDSKRSAPTAGPSASG